MLRKLINKKGISPLVATVIIIAITVAAGITLYAMVFPLINRPIAQTSCTEVTFELDSINSCVDISRYSIADTNIVHMSIDRTKSSSDEPEISKWTLVLDGGQGERRSVVIPSSTFLVSDGEQSTHTEIVNGSLTSAIALPDLKIPLTQVQDDAEDNRIRRISAFPTIIVGGAEVTCEAVTQSVERLRICA